MFGLSYICQVIEESYFARHGLCLLYFTACLRGLFGVNTLCN